MKIIEAPNEFNTDEALRPWIFLAGSIEMGMAIDWQDRFAKALEDYTGTILNPRRRDWDSSWVQEAKNPQFRQQVLWELSAQEGADLILLHFEPETKAPISLLELGLFHKKMHVHCPRGYWRKGNVDLICSRYNVPMWPTLEDLLTVAQDRMKPSRIF